jgi:biotin transport system substrate-specific component
MMPMNTKPAHVDVRRIGLLALPRTSRRLVVGTLGAVVFAGLTLAGANIVVPLQPVPITLQTLFVLLTGAVLGRGFGLLGQSLYVGVGALGIPVFAGSTAGLAVLAGPTGGYLLGFVIAPIVVGFLIRRRASLWWQFLVFYAGSLVILGLGVTHLTLFYTHDFLQSLKVGYFPFIVGDVLKIGAAVSIYRSYRAIASRRSPVL